MALNWPCDDTECQSEPDGEASVSETRFGKNLTTLARCYNPLAISKRFF